MRIGNRIFSIRKASETSPKKIAADAYISAYNLLRQDLTDESGMLRRLISKMARAAAKDYFEELRAKAIDPEHCLGRSHGCGCPPALCRLTDWCTCPPATCVTDVCRVCKVDENLCLGLKEPE